MKVFTAQQMRQVDQIASRDGSLSSLVLMENAALRVVEFLESEFAPLCDQNIVILCGKGNNGGDGFAIARHLLNAGCRFKVFLACSPDGLKGDALANYNAFRATGASVEEISGGSTKDWLAHATSLSPQIDIAVDALLGTGFHGEVRDERLQNALAFAALSPRVRVAVDIPSGLNADSGEAAPEAVRAEYTVTFAAPKRGMFLRQGIAKCGEIWVGGIGAPQNLLLPTGAECITHEMAARLMPHRAVDAHKGTAGRVVVCGGSLGMSGAPTLASRASLRVGAGLCIACLPERIMSTFAASFLEATSHALPCDDEGRLIPSAADAVHEYSRGANVLALGPGLSRSPGALDFARRVVTETQLPIVVDADALYSLRLIEDQVRTRSAPTILTPHPGEMGELLQMTTEDVQNDRIAAATECAKKYHAIVVLKGARSIIALPDGRIFFNLTGNPGMATGGSGDVLTGTIAGLLAQTEDAQTATLLGVYLHGLAGDIAGRTRGNGLIAGDIADALPQAILELDKVETPISPRLRRLS